MIGDCRKFIGMLNNFLGKCEIMNKLFESMLLLYKVLIFVWGLMLIVFIISSYGELYHIKALYNIVQYFFIINILGEVIDITFYFLLVNTFALFICFKYRNIYFKNFLFVLAFDVWFVVFIIWYLYMVT